MMGQKRLKYPVTEKMMRNALGDQEVELFAVQMPRYFKGGGGTGYQMLFTKEVTWPGSSEHHPVHMGIYLKGNDEFLNHRLFTEWYIVMSDLREPGFDLGIPEQGKVEAPSDRMTGGVSVIITPDLQDHDALCYGVSLFDQTNEHRAIDARPSRAARGRDEGAWLKAEEPVLFAEV